MLLSTCPGPRVMGTLSWRGIDKQSACSVRYVVGVQVSSTRGQEGAGKASCKQVIQTEFPTLALIPTLTPSAFSAQQLQGSLTSQMKPLRAQNPPVAPCVPQGESQIPMLVYRPYMSLHDQQETVSQPLFSWIGP